MKVIQLSTFFHPSVGGVERQVEEIAVHLKKQGIDVQVFTTNATHGKDRTMQRLDDTFKDVPIRRFKYMLSLGYFFRFAPSLVWALIWAKYDILHIHNIHDAHLIPAIIVAGLKRKKIVVTGHNPFVVSSEKRGKSLHLFVGIFEAVLRLVSWRINLYVALLESEKQEVHRRFKFKSSKVIVIPNGIQELFYFNDGDATKFYSQWEIKPEKWQLIVGTASRINYVKGLQNLRMAVEKLPKVLFLFVGGDGGYLEPLKKMYSNRPNVIFTEQYVTSEEVKDFLQAVDIFLLPSIYEPFGLTVVEAMAQGRMVLASRVGGPSEILNADVGELLDPSDQQQWYERIKYYAQNKQEALQKGQQAKKMANQYQWDRVTDSLIGAYKALGA